jgi:hypothetical protein
MVSTPWAGSEPVLVDTDAGLVWIGRDGKQIPLARSLSGDLYFESDDCSGPPVAAGSKSQLTTWFDVSFPWPSDGADRKAYAVTSTDASWVGISTRFNSRWTEFYGSGCVPGAPGYTGLPNYLTRAYELIEVPDAPIFDDVPGPLTVQVSAP